MENLLDIARAVRTALYDLTSSRILGIEFDIVLHLVISALIFAAIGRRYGTRRAVLVLAVLIVAKEIADIFLKSQVQYIIGNITAAPVEIFVDIILDVLAGVLGAFLAWIWMRLRNRQSGTPVDSPRRAA